MKIKKKISDGCHIIDWKYYYHKMTDTESLSNIYISLGEEVTEDVKNKFFDYRQKKITEKEVYYDDYKITKFLKNVDLLLYNYFASCDIMCKLCKRITCYHYFSICEKCIDSCQNIINEIKSILENMYKTISDFSNEESYIFKEIIKKIYEEHKRTYFSTNQMIDIYYNIKYKKQMTVLSKLFKINNTVNRENYMNIIKQIYIRMDYNELTLIYMLQNRIYEKINFIKFNDEITINYREKYDFWGVIEKNKEEIEFIIEVDDCSHRYNIKKDNHKNNICRDKNIKLLRVNIMDINIKNITHEKFIEKYDIIYNFLTNI